MVCVRISQMLPRSETSGESCQMERVTDCESISRPGKKRPSLIFAPLWPGYLLLFKVKYQKRVHGRHLPCKPMLFPPLCAYVEPQTGKKVNSSAYCILYRRGIICSYFTYILIDQFNKHGERQCPLPDLVLEPADSYLVCVSMFTCHGNVALGFEGWKEWMQPWESRSHAHPSPWSIDLDLSILMDLSLRLNLTMYLVVQQELLEGA